MERNQNVYDDADLLKKAFLQELDEAEQQAFSDLLRDKPELRQVYDDCQQGEAWKTSLANYRKYSGKEAYQDFLRRIHSGGKKEAPRRRFWMRGWHAVAAVLLLAAGISFWWLQFAPHSGEVAGPVPIIEPGAPKARLVLTDGSVIDVGKKDVQVVVNGVKVDYDKRGLLSYHTPQAPADPAAQDAGLPEPAYNKLIIPRGGENTVVLSDGTTVRLNAGSRLTYPVFFTGRERRVLLEGEAYFEVTRDEKRRFVVETSFGDISVLGTAFNVHAYGDSKACYTTLVQGKVSVETKNHGQLSLLPGEQAVVSPAGAEKKEVDVEEYVGWVNGVYLFKNKPLEDIMDTFSRWYDITVFYETPALRRLAYSGNVKRYDSINSFLDALALTGDIRYKINGKRVLIYETTDED